MKLKMLSQVMLHVALNEIEGHPLFGITTRVDVNGIWMAKCDFCEKLLNATQGISSLRKQVLKCLDDHQEATNSTNTSFDQNVDKSKVAKMIIMHELPLRFVEYTGFQEMI
ncbi:hypothetical protein Ddye_021694 [Dipteronia dyeriana]|uniref:Uncharacterized protein n=1 Tax=Dipteronia dyeriana TaxID=168575 RepID=A0AAD9WWH9_9ROSI|nr:hypothetical protein Ddye_021694 [Dipteronia dyeriana]